MRGAAKSGEDAERERIGNEKNAGRHFFLQKSFSRRPSSKNSYMAGGATGIDVGADLRVRL
jgi:hypothetical protein